MRAISKTNRVGFSLLELMAVVIIIGVIASLVLSRVVNANNAAKESACQHNRVLINSAIERYSVINDVFPTTLNDLNTTDYFPQGFPACPVSGATYSLNTTTNRVNGHSGGAH